MLKRTTKPLKRRVLVEEGQAKSSKKQHSETQTSGIFVKQVVFHTVNHRGPLPLKELHSTGETIVWRDPGGSWACLPPVHKCNHSATVCDTRGIHPKQHTKKRGALGNTKKTKTTRRRAGMWVEEVYENDPKGSIQNERSPMKCYMEQKLSNNNSLADEGQRKSSKMNQSNWKEALQKPLSEEQHPTKCWKEQQNH